MYQSVLQARVSPIPPSSLVTGVAVTVMDSAFTKTVILMYQSILVARVSPIPPSSLVTGVVVILDPAFITKTVILIYHSILQARVSPISLVTGVAVKVLDCVFTK